VVDGEQGSQRSVFSQAKGRRNPRQHCPDEPHAPAEEEALKPRVVTPVNTPLQVNVWVEPSSEIAERLQRESLLCTSALAASELWVVVTATATSKAESHPSLLQPKRRDVGEMDRREGVTVSVAGWVAVQAGSLPVSASVALKLKALSPHAVAVHLNL